MIDCHVHTEFSDGSNSVLELAEQAQKLGHSALVITDHDTHGHERKSAIAVVNFLRQQKMCDFPIIVGSEIQTPFGECLMFGGRALDQWGWWCKRLENVKREWNATLWCQLFKEYVLAETLYNSWCGITQKTSKEVLPYGLVWCHPTFGAHYPDAVPPEFLALLHGYEVEGHGKNFEWEHPDTIKKLREKLPGKRELRDSDAHHVKDLGRAFNECCATTEDELIVWLNQGVN